MNISVTTSMSRFSDSSITPIMRLAIPFTLVIIRSSSSGSISGFASQYLGMNLKELYEVLNSSAISGIHHLLLRIAGVVTAKISASGSLLFAARGLKAIVILSSLYSLLNTVRPAMAVIIAVILCCPSIKTFLPEDIVPSFNLTLGFFHSIIYPVG